MSLIKTELMRPICVPQSPTKPRRLLSTFALLVTMALTFAACAADQGEPEGEALSGAGDNDDTQLSEREDEGEGEDPEQSEISSPGGVTSTENPPTTEAGSPDPDPPATEIDVTTTTTEPPPSVPQPDHHWSLNGGLSDQVAGVDIQGLVGTFGAGYQDRALVFASTDDSGSILPQQFPTDGRSFTIAAWINPSKSDYGTIISQVGGDVTPGDFALRTQEGQGSNVKLFLWRRPGSDTAVEAIESGLVIPLNQWTHVVAVYGATADGGANMRLYANGEVIADAVGGSHYNGARGDAITRIGTSELAADTGGATQHQWAYAGSIDELMIFDRALSSDEVKQMFEHYDQYL